MAKVYLLLHKSGVAFAMSSFFFSPKRAFVSTLLGVLLVSSLVSGCRGKVVDPLAQDRARLLAESRKNVFHQDASLLLSPGFIQEQVQREVDALLAKNNNVFRFDAGQGITFLLSPKALLGEVSVLPATQDRMHVQSKVMVSIAVQMDGGLPIPIPPLTFTATLNAHLGVRLGAKGVVLEKRRPDDGLSIESIEWGELGSFLPSEMKARVQREIETYFARIKDDTPLFSIPPSPVNLNNIRARSVADKGVAVDFSFALLEHSAPADAPKIESGALLVLPEKTLFELTRAAALRSEPIRERTFEPSALTLSDEGFVLDLRVWTMKAKPTARTYRSKNRVEVREGALHIESQNVEEVGEGAGDIGPLRWFERSKILEALGESLSQVVAIEGERFEVTSLKQEARTLWVELQSTPLP